MRQQFIVHIEEQYVVAEAVHNILQALAYFESNQRRAGPHVLTLQALQHLLLLTILYERQQTLVCGLSNKLVSVGTPL